MLLFVGEDRSSMLFLKSNMLVLVIVAEIQHHELPAAQRLKGRGSGVLPP